MRPVRELSPTALRNLAALGETGAAWLKGLPLLVEDLQRRWSIAVGKPMPNGTEAYVAEAVSASGEPSVLKVPIPGVDRQGREVDVLSAANGRGYVRLLRHDRASGAMLLERLGAQLFQLGYPIEKQIEIICATLREAWRPPPPGLRLMSGAEKADALADTVSSVTRKFRAACSRRTVEVALRFARQRREAFDPTQSVLGHGDAHCWNTLADPATGGFKFIDPDGFFIERAHDLSISLREWSDDLLSGDPVSRGHERCDRLARLTGVGSAAIWQWGLIETLANGLLYLDVGSAADAASFLAVAEAWAHAEPD